MTPEEKLKEGHLDEALKLLTAQVRSNPADARRRVFLFQLLALRGDWDRAQNQLKVAGELDAMNAMLVGAYGSVMKAELQRTEVFSGRRAPTIIGEPDAWLAFLLQALQFDIAGQHAQAAPLREQGPPVLSKLLDDAVAFKHVDVEARVVDHFVVAQVAGVLEAELTHAAFTPAADVA